MRFRLLVLGALYTLNCLAQDPCSYQSTSKKGGFWVFSTFYQPNTQIKLEGVCEELNNGKPYLYRSFKSGRLLKEIIYSTSNEPGANQLMTSLEIKEKRKDSIIGELKQFSENGTIQLHERYYFDSYQRRCVHRRTFHANGNIRFDQFFAWVKEEELTDYQRPNHPPHTIDSEGYTYLQVPFGREQTFDADGLLLEEKFHQLLMDGSHEFSSLDGPFKSYFHNGQLKEIGTYKNGKLHGEWTAFNFLGDTIIKGFYDNGIKDGAWIYTHDNGLTKAIHQHNVLGKFPFHARKKEWSTEGQLILWYDFNEEGIGFLKEWSDQGVLLHEQQLVNMAVDKGVESFWFPNGQLKSIMNHRQQADTLYHEWYESGREKVLKRSYEKNGLKTTSIQEWYPNGHAKTTVEIQKGNELSVYSQQKYYENGNLSYVDFRKNREQFIEEYASNGIKIRALKFLENKLHGRYQEMDSTGRVLVDINYQNGVRHGNYRYYSPEGQLKYEANYDQGKWIPIDNKQVTFATLFQRLSTKEKDPFYSAAYTLMNQQLYIQEPIEKSSRQIDTLAAVIWQLKRIAPNYQNWVTSPVIGSQVLTIRMIESYFKDLKTDQIWTEWSTELLAGLKQLNVQLPSFAFVQGEANVSIELNHWINLATLKQLFPKTNALMQLTNKFNPNEGENVRQYPRYSIEQKNAYWQINLPTENGSYSILLYGDGIVEIENQTISWSAFLEADLEQKDKFDRWEKE